MKIRLVETCGACPEQYDAFYKGRVVGYLRLRHGYFSVSCPFSGDEVVYSAHPKGDGLFDADEQARYLKKAKKAIKKWIRAQR